MVDLSRTLNSWQIKHFQYEMEIFLTFRVRLGVWFFLNLYSITWNREYQEKTSLKKDVWTCLEHKFFSNTIF